MDVIKVLVVEDDLIMWDAYPPMLEPAQEILIAGKVHSGIAALEFLESEQVDVILMDIKMDPGINGIETTKRILERHPVLKVLALTIYDNEAFIKKMFQAGAKGYILKRTTRSAELILAIREVASGQKYWSKGVSKVLIDEISQPPSIKKAQEALTKREIEVLFWIVDGKTSNQIANILFISSRTVDTHRANIKAKTECNTLSELVKWALKNGYDKPPPT